MAFDEASYYFDCLWHAEYVPMLLSLFCDGVLEISYLRTYKTDLQQIFRIGTQMGGHDQSDHFAIAQGTLLW